MTDRKCVGCGEIKDRNQMIKITKDHKANTLVINGKSDTFGRSAYLCYNKSCIENALKKNKLQKILKTPVSEELKGKIINEL